MNTSVGNDTMCGGRWVARELRLISRPCIFPSRLANFCHVLPTCWNTLSASPWWCFSESRAWLAHQQGSFHLKQAAFKHTATKKRGQLATNAWVALDWHDNVSLIAQPRVNAYQNQNQNQLYSPSVCKHTRNLLWFLRSSWYIHAYIHTYIHTYI